MKQHWRGLVDLWHHPHLPTPLQPPQGREKLRQRVGEKEEQQESRVKPALCRLQFWFFTKCFFKWKLSLKTKKQIKNQGEEKNKDGCSDENRTLNIDINKHIYWWQEIPINTNQAQLALFSLPGLMTLPSPYWIESPHACILMRSPVQNSPLASKGTWWAAFLSPSVCQPTHEAVGSLVSPSRFQPACLITTQSCYLTVMRDSMWKIGWFEIVQTLLWNWKPEISCFWQWFNDHLFQHFPN